MSDKCVCYVNMTVDEMKKLTESLRAEAIVGSIPTHFKEKDYMDVLRKARISPGNKKRLLEILRENEKRSGFDEKERSTISKLHASNLYYTEDAILMSLHEIVKSELYRREKQDVETVRAVILAREEGTKYWIDLIEDDMLKDKRLSAADEFYGYMEYVYAVIEIFQLSKERFTSHVKHLIEKDKKEYPRACIKLAIKFGIKIDTDEYSKIADEIMEKANSVPECYAREGMAKEALCAYEALNVIGRLSVERFEVLEEYQKKDVQHAIRKASKLLKNNFTYIPRGFWDRIS